MKKEKKVAIVNKYLNKPLLDHQGRKEGWEK